jgi:D-alanyl-D-alanine carboxypeptidase
MKTGYTKIAGYNLISSASKNKNSVISILVGCESLKKRDQLSIYFLDSSFKRLNDKDFLENKISFSDFLYDGQSE